MTLVAIVLLIAVVALFAVVIRWILALAHVAVPDAVYVLASIIVILLVLTGQCSIPPIGIGGK